MDDDSLIPWLVGLGFLAVILRVTYKMGFEAGRKDVLDPPNLRPLTEDEKTRLLMKRTLPRWRRIAGRVAMIMPGFLFVVFLHIALRYGNGSAWVFALGLTVYLGVQMAGIWSMERLWRPFREAQEEARRAKRDGN